MIPKTTQIRNELSDDEFFWFAERTETLPSGLVTFSNYAVQKFKRLTNQENESNTVIRHQMLDLFGKYA